MSDRLPAGLVESAMRGDQRAFGELLRRHQRICLATAYGVVEDADEAVDVFQEASLKAFRALGQLQDPERFSAWLLAIVRSTATDLVRRRVRWGTREYSVPEEELPEGGHGPSGGNAGPGPDELLLQEEEAGRIRAALAELSSEYREVLLLKHLDGLSYREIAELLGVTEKAVESRLFRARQQLAALLQKNNE